jgi:hypothetical protein
MGSHAALQSWFRIETNKTSFVVQNTKKGRENNKYYA